MEPDDGNNTDESSVSKEEENEKIEVTIRDRLNKFVYPKVYRQLISYSTLLMSDCSICRVPEALRSVNPKAYTPQFISIGPLHHAESSKHENVIVTEKKCCYVLNFLAAANLDWDKIIQHVLNLEERVRDCYMETITMEKAEFVKLVILDGCFVVMYMLGSVFEESRDIDTSFLWKFKDAIFRDLLLFENQLPFFLLQSLYDLICASNNQSSLSHGNCSFIQLARRFFISNANERRMSYLERGSKARDDDKAVNHFVHFLSFMHSTRPDSSELLMDHSGSTPLSVWPPTATELHDCGISFQKKSVFSQIVFTEHTHTGILRVPHIIINESFEIKMRNIIAYEHCHRKTKDVSNFVMFMHFLLTTNKDVNLLVNEGIIQNHLGSTKEVTKLFHDLCKNVVIETNLYNSECKRMKEYCKHRRHQWWTSLKRNYFGTPWAFISFIAALLLLSLTILQAVVAVVALYK